MDILAILEGSDEDRILAEIRKHSKLHLRVICNENPVP